MTSQSDVHTAKSAKTGAVATRAIRLDRPLTDHEYATPKKRLLVWKEPTFLRPNHDDPTVVGRAR